MTASDTDTEADSDTDTEADSDMDTEADSDMDTEADSDMDTEAKSITMTTEYEQQNILSLSSKRFPCCEE
jgi:hypothetical protein